jgi:hypothetical protein
MGQLLTPKERVASIALAYYRQANELLPSMSELVAWIAGLRLEVRTEVLPLNLAGLLLLPAFRRYILERRGYSMAAYMAAYLSGADFLYWVDNMGDEMGWPIS